MKKVNLVPLTQEEITKVVEQVILFFGEVDVEFQNVIKQHVIVVDRNLQLKYPNYYNSKDYELLLINKTAYRLNEKKESTNKTILSEENQLKALENAI